MPRRSTQNGGKRLAHALMLSRCDTAAEQVAEFAPVAEYDVLPAVRVQHCGAHTLGFLTAAATPAHAQEVSGVQGRLVLQDAVDRHDQLDQLVHRAVAL